MNAAAPSENIYGIPLDFHTFQSGWAFKVSEQVRASHYFIEQDTEQNPFCGRYGRIKFFRALCGARASSTSRHPFLKPGYSLRCQRCTMLAAKRGLI